MPSRPLPPHARLESPRPRHAVRRLAVAVVAAVTLVGLSDAKRADAADDRAPHARIAAVVPRTPHEDPPPRAREPAPLDDADEDGLSDAREDELAERFAPIVIHSSDETNLPTNVDDFLRKTTLGFQDDACGSTQRLRRAPTQEELTSTIVRGACGDASVARSDGTRSRGKHRTFFLADVDDDARAGARDSRAWTTYVHAYPNDHGGVTLQYWRFYAYNDAFNDHGGDWEGMHVVLDEGDRPVRVVLLGHSDLRTFAPEEVGWEGTHPRVFSEGGGHATRANGHGVEARGCAHWPCWVSLEVPSTFIRQETWSGGHVQWPDGARTAAGALVNVGERRHPLRGQTFIRYSGLWGSPGTFYFSSGYWGPAFNETQRRVDGFATAWCLGRAAIPRATARHDLRDAHDPRDAREPAGDATDDAAADLRDECFPTDEAP